MGVGGRAPLLLEPRNRDEIRDVILLLKGNGIPFRILGGGSNVLIQDKELDEVVISTKAMGRLIKPEEDECLRRVDAGVTLARFVSACRKFALSGAEGLVGIPGTVGGAAKMNAGGRHGWIGQLIEGATIINEQGDIESRALGPEDFSYRTSPFDNEVVIDLNLRLEKGNEKQIWERTTQILTEKKAQQPLLKPSCGCIFKNPPNDSAGRLLDEVGMKGVTRGDAMVSDLHANFILNGGDCSYEDYYSLIQEGKNRVFESFGVKLELEIKLW